MKNPALITANIADRFAKEFGRSLTEQELAFVKEASREALGKIRGRVVKKLVTEKIGTGNGLCRFEDIANNKEFIGDLRLDIRRAVHKEVMECILEIAGELGPRIGNSAIEFVKDWGDMGDYERVLEPLVTPKANQYAVAQRRWRKAHRDAATKNMREWRMKNRAYSAERARGIRDAVKLTPEQMKGYSKKNRERVAKKNRERYESRKADK